MEPTPELLDRYAAVLQDYLKGGGETALKRAHELGGDALAAGASLVEFARAQLEALVTILRDVPSLEEGAQLAGRAVDVFVESLSPFEIVHRGFQEAWTTMRESEQRYRNLIEIVPDVVFTLSPDGVVTSLNPAFERVTGWSREEWLGKHFGPYIHPGDLPFAEGIFQRVLQEEAPLVFQLRVQARSGKYLIHELAATPEVRDGEVVGIVGIARHITQPGQAEDALRSLFNGVPVGLCRMTPRGQILDANPALAQMLGFSDIRTLLRANAADFYINPEDRSRWKAQMGRWGVVRDFEVALRRHNGTILWARNSSRAVKDEDGRVLYYEGVLEDITERKHAERALRHLNEMLEEEAKRIAHALHDEAGQVLTSVHLDLEAAAREVPAAADRLRGVRRLLKQFEEQLRCLSHELRPAALDDLGLLPALEFLAKGVSKRTGVPITVDGMGQGRLPPSVEIALYRIVQEGLTNAAKYAQATRVWIEIQQTDHLVRGSLRDNGAGFDVTETLTRRGERGIGLVGMRERAEALGGTLQVKSAPGRGTEVLVTIPLGQ